ncbi:uncharacterized protein LOC111717918 [Eurytemora carolleeae]|uniref:uncharacterized protein LOC111717918 n=1 Tax=Eurytemora carolleeae TaxID=1294199 RepID=UPI000C762434|nr:uncharacterized protein LOC111717918 [Eurytemora carolleeae]|eukprot:XP_023349152.1 uncharacterized protein LOC111717918 [Eurytemora affinis]
MAAATRCLLIRTSLDVNIGLRYNKASFALKCSAWAELILLSLCLTYNSSEGILYHTCMGHTEIPEKDVGIGFTWVVGSLFNITSIVSYLSLTKSHLKVLDLVNLDLADEVAASRKRNLLPAKIEARQFGVSLLMDLIHCVGTPALILYSSTELKKKAKRIMGLQD